ncbi:MAG: hypothetical protein H6760_04240 [Candidatus Nomurabacteria bacterium]|nr:MAG: hypothetical protein H6760_04240 [Candidatus Nomurabacteria bacterium]
MANIVVFDPIREHFSDYMIGLASHQVIVRNTVEDVNGTLRSFSPDLILVAESEQSAAVIAAVQRSDRRIQAPTLLIPASLEGPDDQRWQQSRQLGVAGWIPRPQQRGFKSLLAEDWRRNIVSLMLWLCNQLHREQPLSVWFREHQSVVAMVGQETYHRLITGSSIQYAPEEYRRLQRTLAIWGVRYPLDRYLQAVALAGRKAEAQRLSDRVLTNMARRMLSSEAQG